MHVDTANMLNEEHSASFPPISSHNHSFLLHDLAHSVLQQGKPRISMKKRIFSGL